VGFEGLSRPNVRDTRLSPQLIHYLPLVTTVMAALFFEVLRRHWRRNRSARHVMWWMIGVGLYGLGTLTEALTTVLGWSEPVFRTWYIAGALLGGAPLAQGSVYLLVPRRTADRLTVALLSYITIASAFVISTPIVHELVESHRLSGDVMTWQWVRLLSPFVNLYAVVFLIGGAIWSAWRYRKTGGARSRVLGNVLIAVGAILPGIGGSFARAGRVEVLYVTELIGLALIWAGYRLMTGDRALSIHQAQTVSSSPNPERQGTS
jgi:hypothetical protein